MATEQLITTTESTLIKICDNSEEEGEKRVLLKVQSSDNEANHLYYLMSRNTPLRQLMISYTERIGVSFNSVRFVFGGQVIKPSYSADCLELEDEDLIDVVPYDGFGTTTSIKWTLITLPRPQGELPILLEVVDCLEMFSGKLCYQIGRNTPLKVLAFDFADRICELAVYIVLMFKGWGFDVNKTADELGFKDGDVIFPMITAGAFF